MCHTHIVIRAARALFQQIYPQNRGRHVRLMPIGVSACLMAAFSVVAFMKVLDLLHQAMCAVRTGAPPRPLKRTAKWVHFILLFWLLLPWRPPGRYGASSCRMVASSGFWCSLGHAALGDVICIAPSHRHGYQNGQQQKYFFSLLPPLSFVWNIAERPCYGPLNQMLSYCINLIGVISLFVCYWPSPATMDAVLATIVADRWAWFQ